MPLLPEFIAPIPWPVRRRLGRLMARLPELTEIPHQLPVTIVPAPGIKAGEGYGFGAFARDGQEIGIWIAGNPLGVMPMDEFVELAASTLAHELVHYEQWRDGRQLSERGVEVRTRNLLRRADETRLPQRAT